MLDGSRMSREAHVRFCEGLGVRFPRPTHHELHWVLDMAFSEDAARHRARNLAHNLTTLRHFARVELAEHAAEGPAESSTALAATMGTSAAVQICASPAWAQGRVPT